MYRLRLVFVVCLFGRLWWRPFVQMHAVQGAMPIACVCGTLPCGPDSLTCLASASCNHTVAATVCSPSSRYGLLCLFRSPALLRSSGSPLMALAFALVVVHIVSLASTFVQLLQGKPAPRFVRPALDCFCALWCHVLVPCTVRLCPPRLLTAPHIVLQQHLSGTTLTAVLALARVMTHIAVQMRTLPPRLEPQSHELNVRAARVPAGVHVRLPFTDYALCLPWVRLRFPFDACVATARHCRVASRRCRLPVNRRTCHARRRWLLYFHTPAEAVCADRHVPLVATWLAVRYAS